jgi:hypothetical protein
VPEDPVFESGEEVVQAVGPIPAGPAPDGTHVSFAASFIQQSGSFQFLNARDDGDVTDGDLITANFGTLEDLDIDRPPDHISFDRNGATDIADPTGPGGATFNTELSAEWGRVSQGHIFDDGGSLPIDEISFTWIATTDPTPDADLPPMGSGLTGTYSTIVGGSFPVRVFDADANASNGITPVVETGTHEITVKINFDTAKVDLFQIDATFPGAKLHLINEDGGTNFLNGSIFFEPFVDTRNRVVINGSSFPVFGNAVFGAAGPQGIGLTGAYHANTFGSDPPNAFNSSFAAERTSLGPSAPPMF